MLRNNTDNPVDAVLTYKPLELLGKGSDGGSVTKYQLKLHCQDPTLKEQPNVKKFLHAMSKNEWAFKSDYYFGADNEKKIFKRYQPIFHSETFHKEYPFIRVMPGQQFTAWNCSMLNFSQRLNLVNQLVITLNMHHHKTPRTGSAVVHGDLKSQNIMFHYSLSTGRIEVNLIDYELAIKIKDDPNMLIKDNKGALNPYYFPPEVLEQGESRWGIKTDIYMVEDVISNNMPLLYDEKIASIFPIIQPLYDQFLKRMRAPAYAERPDSDETLSFFNTLFLLYKLYDKNIDDPSLKQAYITKLAMLSYNKYHHFDFFDPENHKTNQRIYAFLKSPFLKEAPSIAPFTTPDMKTACDSLNQQGVRIDHCVIATLLKSSSLINQINQNEKPEKWSQLFLSTLASFSDHVLTLEEKREQAITLITSVLKKATSAKQIAEFVVELEVLAEDGKIDYLYKRQGFFQISLFNHTWENKPVSHTWLKVMALASNYANRLPKVESNSNPNLEETQNNNASNLSPKSRT